MLTIRDLAKAAGVSKTTAWGALKGDKRVAESTRTRIQKLAKDLNYRPNHAFRQMCRQIRCKGKISYRSTIAVVHHFNCEDPENRDPFHRDFMEGLRHEADSHSLKVSIFWANEPGLSAERLTDILSNRGIQGLIIPSSNTFRTLDLNWEDFRSIATGFSLQNPYINRVNADFQQATSLCIQNLLDLGYKRIGMALPDVYDPWPKYNLSVPYFWYQSFSGTIKTPPVLMLEDSMKSTFLDWLDRYQFDALITSFPKVMDWCKEASIRIPEDLGVVFATPLPSELGHVSKINYHPRRIGRAVVNLLTGQLLNNETITKAAPKMTFTRVSWEIGSTTQTIGRPQRNFQLTFPSLYPYSESSFEPDE